jgi:lipopolysaccharide transport protein LptA
VVALLDPQNAPPGAVPVEGKGPAPGAKPVPQAEIDKARSKKGEEKKEVEIFAQGGSVFNSKANLVVFDTNVVVKHPAFDLVCDKLIVFLKSGAEEGDSALDKAIATGKKVTVQKIGEDGEVQIGQARKVTFEESNGDVVLEDWPQVQTGNTLILAKEQGTIIILNQNGKMKVNGPHITKLILPEKKEVAAPAP